MSAVGREAKNNVAVRGDFDDMTKVFQAEVSACDDRVFRRERGGGDGQG